MNIDFEDPSINNDCFFEIDSNLSHLAPLNEIEHEVDSIASSTFINFDTFTSHELNPSSIVELKEETSLNQILDAANLIPSADEGDLIPTPFSLAASSSISSSHKSQPNHSQEQSLTPILSQEETILDIEAIKPPVNVSETTNVGFEPLLSKESASKLDITTFKPLTEEQINKMSVQQLLEHLLKSCYLIQFNSKRIHSDFLQAMQQTMDAVVKKLSTMQSTTNWAVPSFVGIGISAISGLTEYKDVLNGVGNALNALKEVMQQLDRSNETPVSAHQSQLTSSIQSYKEQTPTQNNELEKTLNQLESTSRSLHDLIMRMFGL